LNLPRVSVTLKRTMSDGNYGSTTIGVMVDEVVKEGEKKSVVLDRLLQQEAAFIKAKFKELNQGLGQEGLE
jgi:hypothetical protein